MPARRIAVLAVTAATVALPLVSAGAATAAPQYVYRDVRICLDD
ncbi:hypothetical protein ACWDBD_21855 [Streptomyces sp. NPDC001118]